MGHHDLPSKICCLTVPKNFVGEPSVALKRSGIKQNLWIRKRGKHDFPSKRCCLTVAKNFVKDLSFLCFRKFRVSKSVKDKRGGGIEPFGQIFVVIQYRQTS